MNASRQPGRQLVYWSARHDNGWVTSVLENPDGTYAAWAAEDSTLASVDYIETDAETAMRAAEYALRTKSGHQRCSRECSTWEMQTHQLDPPAGE
jgi:hypothetical protein